MRFLHAADLHLDTPASGLRSYGAEVADVLRDASLRAFDNLVEVALSHRVAFCLFAGDIYDGAERGTRAQLRFRDGLKRLSDAGIRSFIVHGNHDPADGNWTAVRHWPEAVTIFGPNDVDSVSFDVDGVPVTVHGISYGERHEMRNLSLRFPRPHGGGIQIGLLHSNVGHTTGHENYAPCTLDDLRAAGIDYWALGHVHVRQLLGGPGPWIAYPGNLQGRHPGAAELGAKGAVIVECTPSGVILEPRFVALDVIRFHSLDISIDGVADLGALADLLREHADDLRRHASGRPVILSASLRGSGPVHRALATGTDDLHAELTSAPGDPFVWWDRLDDRTSPEIDLAAAARADDFLGNVLRTLDDWTDEQAVATLVGRAPAALRNVLDLDAEAVRRSAKVVAHDALAGGRR